MGLIEAAHGHGLTVVADMVINHNSGADSEEINPITGRSRWTRFQPKSEKFARDWECFHPYPYETWDDGTFGDMPDLSHRNPYVFGEILKLARWIVEEIGFDGFRYDFVKGYGPWIVTVIQEYRYLRNGRPFKPYGVGEHWDSARTIDNWVNETNAWNDNPVDAFDFPLRDMLKALCDVYGFSLRNLATRESARRGHPMELLRSCRSMRPTRAAARKCCGRTMTSISCNGSVTTGQAGWWSSSIIAATGGTVSG